MTVPCEAVTVLDFVHVLDSPTPGKLAYGGLAARGDHLARLGDARFRTVSSPQ